MEYIAVLSLNSQHVKEKQCSMQISSSLSR